MTVFLWGRPDEPVVASVARACAQLGIPAIAADGDSIVAVDLAGDLVIADGTQVAIDQVTGILVRPDTRLVSQHAIDVFQTLMGWCELAEARVLNRPSAGASNRSKPYQLALIAAAGFAVPDTLVTTDPADARAFRAEHGTVVYKSVSGVRSIVATLSSDDDGRLDDISTCPTQFQQFIAGVDFRVHVVGDAVFACRIESSAVDYRYAAPRLFPATLSAELTAQCVSLGRALGLGLAGIDLRQDQHGAWWCFEVNTSPGFTWFEQYTGLAISTAVARALAPHGPYVDPGRRRSSPA